MATPFPPALLRLIRDLERLPGVGEKSATRFALQILRWPREQARELAQAIYELHDRIRLCSQCHTFSETDPCAVCSDPGRIKSILCVVEDPADILAIEKSGAYQGRYHVLHGAISPLDGIGPAQLKIPELLSRLHTGEVAEVIIATSSTASGEATAAYLSDCLAQENVKVTRIACGIPMGMDLKYADQVTLRRAIAARCEMG